jgi:hypothetical protein
MREPPAADEPRSILRRIIRLLVFRIAVGVALVCAAAWWIFRPGTPDGRTPAPAITAPSTPGGQHPASVAAPAAERPVDEPRAARSRSELKTVYTASENARALAKVKQGRFVRLADEAKAAVDAALALAQRFASESKALRTDERGRRIAASTDLVERFRTLAGREVATVDQLTHLADEIDQLAAPARRALADPDDLAIPDPGLDAEILRFRSDADAFRVELGRANRELKMVVDEAGTVSPGPSTLSEAISERERAELLEADRVVAGARERALREAAELRAKTEAEAIRIAAASETEAILESARQKKEAAEAELAERRAAQAKEALRRRARSPDVAQYLGAFLAKGYKQPLEFQGAYMNFDATSEPKPISFSRLKAVGALDSGDAGLSALAWVASDPKNDRPPLRYGTYPGDWSHEAREFLLRAQQLLRELGPTLVEEGRLAP